LCCLRFVELALGALLAAAKSEPDCLLPLGFDCNPHGVEAAIVARLSTQAGVAAGTTEGKQLSSTVVARAEAAQKSLQALKVAKPAKGLLKAAQAKLSLCALWR